MSDEQNMRIMFHGSSDMILNIFNQLNPITGNDIIYCRGYMFKKSRESVFYLL